MYENACKLMAKQKVALECLSYHATASQDQTEKLTQDAIADADTYNLYSFTFTGSPNCLYILHRGYGYFIKCIAFQTSSWSMMTPAGLFSGCSCSATWSRSSRYPMM